MTPFFVLRPYKPEDKAFVMATFLRGLYYGESWFSMIPKDIFMSNYKLVGEALISKATVHVACLPDDPDVILGYSILSTDYSTIHYVFVKSSFRNRGIMKALIPSMPTTVTHLTALGKTLLPKLKDCIFNPFAL